MHVLTWAGENTLLQFKTKNPETALEIAAVRPPTIITVSWPSSDGVAPEVDSGTTDVDASPATLLI